MNQKVFYFFLFSFFLTTSLLAQPTNDSACNATMLAVGTSCTGAAYTNIDATPDILEPYPNCFFGNPADLESVWFSFEMPTSGKARINMSSGTLALIQLNVAVYSVGDCANYGTFSEINCRAAFSSSGNYLNVSGPSGSIYYIQVDGSFSNNGTFCIDVEECIPPTNNIVANAIPLTIDANCFGLAYSSTCADSEPNEPLGACFFNSPTPPVEQQSTVWFSFVCPSTGRVEVEYRGNQPLSSQEVQFAIYEVGNVSDFSTYTEVGCQANSNARYYLIDLIPNQQYYIQVDGAFFEEGDFCIEVNSCAPPMGDLVCDAIDLSPNIPCANFPYSIECATGESNEPSASCFFNGTDQLNTLWFEFVATADGAIVSTDFAPDPHIFNELQLGVYQLTDCADFSTFTEVACDLQNGTLSNDALVQVNAMTQGESYFVQVDGLFTDRQEFCIELWMPILEAPNLDAVCVLSEIPIYQDLYEFQIAGGFAESQNGLDTASFTLVSEQTDQGSCPEIVSRVYEIQDQTGFVAQCTQVIYVGDFIDPIMNCPPTQSFSCNAPNLNLTYSQFLALGGTITDNCGIDTTTFAKSFEQLVLPNCEAFDVVYEIFDNCGNRSECSMMVEVIDSTPPIFTCPMDIQLVCRDTVPAPYPDYLAFQSAGGSASDNCAVRTSSFQLLTESDTGPSCPRTIIRTYEIRDFCENIATCQQLIEFECPTSITITDNPATDDYEAGVAIQTSGTVTIETQALFSAKAVTLSPGFEVVATSTFTSFEISTDGCQ